VAAERTGLLLVEQTHKGLLVRWRTGYLLRNGRFWRGELMAGEVDQAKGRIKKAVGELTDDEDLKREGKIDEASGKVKDATEKVADKARAAVRKK
jgi:uncharacterized protein YjbJ (UPF0337 family)